MLLGNVLECFWTFVFTKAFPRGIQAHALSLTVQAFMGRTGLQEAVAHKYLAHSGFNLIAALASFKFDCITRKSRDKGCQTIRTDSTLANLTF